MAEQQASDHGASMTELRKHATSLASDLAGSLQRISVQSGDSSIEVEWQPQAAEAAAAPEDSASPASAPAAAADGSSAGEAAAGEWAVVSSPMVGTFFRSPSPDAPPFVEVGDAVEQGQTVAIVEAMKLFNPITTELAGVIAEVLVENGQPVEFGQPLLRLKTAAQAAEAASAGEAGRG